MSNLRCCLALFPFCLFEVLGLLTDGTETTPWHERFPACLLTAFALVISFCLICLPLLNYILCRAFRQANFPQACCNAKINPVVFFF